MNANNPIADFLSRACDHPDNPPGTFSHLVHWLAWSFLQPKRMHSILVLDAGQHAPLLRNYLLGVLQAHDGAALDFSAGFGAWFGSRHVLTDDLCENHDWIKALATSSTIDVNCPGGRTRRLPNVWSIVAVSDGTGSIAQPWSRRSFVVKLNPAVLSPHADNPPTIARAELHAFLGTLRQVHLGGFGADSAPPSREVQP